MQIYDFTFDHIEEATQLSIQCYERERSFVPKLPPVDKVPGLKPYADNRLGVVAYEKDAMVGFLCCVTPFRNAFASTDAVGVFSPMGANGAIGDDRAKIYALMYQAAGGKWAGAGASSHAICLYAHEEDVHKQFFRYGFGLRCIDAIRGMDEIKAAPCEEYTFYELAPEDILKVLPLENKLNEYYISSPFFMYREPNDETDFFKSYEEYQSIYFVAETRGQIIAFLRAELDGETFIQNTPGYLHVKGAYCLPEHRGKGVHQRLLNMLVRKLKAEGYTRLGVDFESLNPTGCNFWLKHFDAYTHSVVRRIDEWAVKALC